MYLLHSLVINIGRIFQGLLSFIEKAYMMLTAYNGWYMYIIVCMYLLQEDLKVDMGFMKIDMIVVSVDSVGRNGGTNVE